MTTMDESRADARDMFVVHTMFRREFGLMPGLVRAVTPGDTARAAVVADHVTLMTEGLAAHHQGEDDHIWPYLRERCPGECGALVSVMEDQHRAIHECFRPVQTTAETWRQTASADMRNALVEAVEELVAVTDEHLSLEEERVVPLIEEYLTEAEYAPAAQAASASLPPDKLLIGLGMTIYGADAEAVAMIVGHVPAEARPTIKDQADQAYAAYAETLYGTARPPLGAG